MAQFSDEELLFLSNLLHITNKEPFSEIWKSDNAKKKATIEELIADIDTQKLATEYADTTFDGEISGTEWAAMLEAIKQNEELCSMQLVDLERDDKNALSVCLQDKDGNKYVVFRGTAAGEWPDNFEGAFQADTEQQKRALEFVERQNDTNITVIGHSKGGNKAKYVAVLSDSVSRCVSFDGQGFSQAFWTKYGPLIEKNREKITCYALDYDFVNILLSDIYGKKVYVEGFGVGTNFEQNHSPNSFFCMEEVDEEGGKKWIYSFHECEQSEAMASLHLFVNYIINTADPEEAKNLMTFLGNIANFAMGKQPPDYTEKYSAEELRKFLLDPENAEELGTLIAYIVQYESGGNHITDAIYDILWEMDGGLWNQAKLKAMALLLDYIDDKVGLEALIANIESYGDWLSVLLLQFGVLEDEKEAVAVIKALRVAQEKQKKIPFPDKENCQEQKVSSIKRDFSDEMRATLLQLVEEVENESFWDVSRWDLWYRLEQWCGRLDVEQYKDNIAEYHRKVVDINDTTEKQLQKIFDAIDELDHKYGQMFHTKATEMQEIAQEVQRIMA